MLDTPKIDAIVAAAIGCSGAPWHWHGRDPSSGLDCAGLLIHVAIACGMCHEDTKYSSRTALCGDALVNQVLKSATLVDRKPIPGDIVGFWLRRNQMGRMQHVGIMTGEDTFMHAMLGRGTHRGRLSQGYGRRLGWVFEFREDVDG